MCAAKISFDFEKERLEINQDFWARWLKINSAPEIEENSAAKSDRLLEREIASEQQTTASKK
ncbi:MAG: hypothetical protein KME18_16675 [Phormidium tanganyikae FI6-MK23]|jgi:hypothetical protein|nr:hypothetical protein [Phormidium tanganyikae FI6-MK23]